MEEENEKKKDYDSAIKYGFGRKEDRGEELALIEQIELTHRERQLIRYLVEQYLVESIRYCNLIFDDGIDDYERVLLRATSILRKISNSKEKNWEQIKKVGDEFRLTVEKRDADLDKNEESGSGAKA